MSNQIIFRSMIVHYFAILSAEYIFAVRSDLECQSFIEVCSTIKDRKKLRYLTRFANTQLAYNKNE